MDVVLAILGAVLILAGVVGAIVPALPGPPLAWVGLLLLHLTAYAHFSAFFLIISGICMVAITILDFLIPMYGTKKFGGTKAGVWGSTIGLLAGMFFFPPFGLIIGPFVGAFAAEVLFAGADIQKGLRSATGSFIGFLAGTALKLLYAGFMAFYFVKALL